MVVGVGAGCAAPQNLTLGDFADEHHVAAQINFVFDLAGEHCVHIFRQVIKAVVTAFHGREVRELVHVPSGLHAEVPDGLEGHILCQHADIKFSGRLNDFPGEVPHLAGNGKPCGIRSHLYGGIDDTAVIFVGIPGGEHKQTVGQIAQRRGIFSR